MINGKIFIQSIQNVSENIDVLSVRPKITDLVFQLYGRPLHPELFSVLKNRHIDRGHYSIDVSITKTGHVLTWKAGRFILTEVATASSEPLPKKRRLLSKRLSGEHSDQIDCRNGVTYQTCFHLEKIRSDAFWDFQNELLIDGSKNGLLHRFEYGGRMGLGAVSLVCIETRARSLLVQCFHTFPDDLSIVKTQSVFEYPPLNDS